MEAMTSTPAAESDSRAARTPGRVRRARTAGRREHGRHRALSQRALQQENREFRGSGGISEENRSFGFRPAFFDTESRTPYLSRFGNGTPAPCHVLDGLPDALVMTRDAWGRVSALRPSVISGFLFEGCFYSREEAARKLAQMDGDDDAAAFGCPRAATPALG